MTVGYVNKVVALGPVSAGFRREGWVGAGLGRSKPHARFFFHVYRGPELCRRLELLAYQVESSRVFQGSADVGVAKERLRLGSSQYRREAFVEIGPSQAVG